VHDLDHPAALSVAQKDKHLDGQLCQEPGPLTEEINPRPRGAQPVNGSSLAESLQNALPTKDTEHTEIGIEENVSLPRRTLLKKHVSQT